METTLKQEHVDLLKRLFLLYDSHSFAQMLTSALEILRTAVPCDVVDWYDLDTQNGLRRFSNARVNSRNSKYRIQHIHKLIFHHPVLHKVLQGEDRLAYRLSECISPEEFKKHPLYDLLVGEYKMSYCLIVRIKILHRGTISVSMKRKKKDFSQADVDVAESLARLLTHNLDRIWKQEQENLEMSPERCCAKIMRKLKLNPREAEIAYWIFMSKSNTEISDILRIKYNTVRTHAQNIFRAMKVCSRLDVAQAVLRAMLEDMPSARSLLNANTGDSGAVFAEKAPRRR